MASPSAKRVLVIVPDGQFHCLFNDATGNRSHWITADAFEVYDAIWQNRPTKVIVVSNGNWGCTLEGVAAVCHIRNIPLIRHAKDRSLPNRRRAVELSPHTPWPTTEALAHLLTHLDEIQRDSTHRKMRTTVPL